MKPPFVTSAQQETIAKVFRLSYYKALKISGFLVAVWQKFGQKQTIFFLMNFIFIS